MDFIYRLQSFATRFLGFVVLPAQLPGDPSELLQDLLSDPLGTLKAFDWATARSLVRQIMCYEKLVVPNDSQLERLHTTRTKYLARGWAHCPLTTSDGVTLDAYWRQPSLKDVAPRFILFVGGNAQKYEDWLPYFQLYADDSELGFLCFNFRGVARSEGTITRAEDMLSDVRAAFEHLVESGVKPQHILLHGFSLGGAIAAMFLAQPGAPKAAITSDRSFRSYSHAAFAVCRGFKAACGEAPTTIEHNTANAPSDLRGMLRAHIKSALTWLLLLTRALVATIAFELLTAVGWELNAQKAWRRIEGNKVIVYNTADNIVCYGAASLHGALLAEGGAGGDSADGAESTTSSLDSERQQGEALLIAGPSGGGSSSSRPSSSSSSSALHGTAVVEVTIRYAQGWALHDFPLSLDLDAWYAMIAAERAALGLNKDGRDLEAIAQKNSESLATIVRNI